MNIKLLNKNITIVDSRIILKEETKKSLGLQELFNLKQNNVTRRKQLIEQTKKLKEQYDELCNQNIELDNMIAMLEEFTTEEQPIVLDE